MKVISGKIARPDRTLLIGTVGVGKSTYGSRTRNPLFLCAEEGANELDVARARTDDGGAPTRYEDAEETVRFLTNEEHDFGTLVIDTGDWLHAWIEAFVCDRDKKESIEDFGYGKGHVAAAEEWRRFLASLERMQAKRPVDVLFLVHAAVKRHNPPDSEPYDRFDLKMPEKSAAFLREWCFNMLLAQVDVSVKKGDPKRGEKTKAYSDGGRVLRTQESAAYLAKNRIGLPPTIPFDENTYDVIQAARRATLTAETELDKLLVGHPDPGKVKRWFAVQADKGAALEALRKKAEAARAAEKETEK